jgi:hypothetical protein
MVASMIETLSSSLLGEVHKMTHTLLTPNGLGIATAGFMLFSYAYYMPNHTYWFDTLLLFLDDNVSRPTLSPYVKQIYSA